MSAAYYALFHTLAKSCADMLIGGNGAARSKHAWIEVYRSLAHGAAKAACEHKQVIVKFPQALVDFADRFVELQGKRHEADYNPYAKFYKSDVINDIDAAELVIRQFQQVDLKDRRAFSSWVLFKNIKKNP